MQNISDLSFRILVFITLLSACFSVVTESAFAQETVNNASASGRVTDPSGAAVAGASIVARQIETNISNGTLTDQEGRFRFPYLKPGAYEIKIHSSGFTDTTRAVVLTVGSAFELK